MGKRWINSAMEVDDEDLLGESSNGDENDSDEIKALKSRCHYPESLLNSAKNRTAADSAAAISPSHSPPGSQSNRPQLSIAPSYGILVANTNILLSSLSMISSLVESTKWTVIILLSLVMELGDLSSNPSPRLAEAAATTALNYVTSRIRSLTLLLATSRLPGANIRQRSQGFGVQM
ncbi:hypothetical protein BKA70DRAFT_1436097 [Coprinopsis sp. MPI-PUGE-AT-0042]|nr:hypothetical protein BKA70DRAFT_1436097 [Coprinopsis sp. MPI-PUGE-AT-0042]